MSTRVIAYLRVSTQEQTTDGNSLASQRRRLEGYAATQGWTLVDTIEDPGVSAKDLNRSGLQRALALLSSGQADALLIAKLDRLTRSIKDLEHLLQQYFADKYGLISLGESVDTRTATGILFLHIVTAVSQWERGIIAERTKEGLAEARLQGRNGGRPFYGHTLAEQAVLDTMVELRSQGLSNVAIARELTARGVATRAGEWTGLKVGRRLANVCSKR